MTAKQYPPKFGFRFSAAAWLAAVFTMSLVFSVFAPLTRAAAATTAQSYVIKLLPGIDPGILKNFGGNAEKQFVFSSDSNFANIYKFQSNLNLAQIQNQLGPKAQYIELDFAMRAADAVLNDPGFTSNGQDIDKQWGLVKAGFTQVWNKSAGSKNVVVAVIDTGIDATHEDLQGISFKQGFDFINNQVLNGNVDSDDNGHGTLIAGVLGATPNNSKGIVGTNWAISILPIKALDASGRGDSSTIAEAIVWAADHGANIINLSLGGVGFGQDALLANSIDYAFKKNVLVVAAAGNDVATTGGNLDQNPVFPVCDDNDQNEVLGVAATDQNDLKAVFSNYGKNCIDVTAPGKRILSTINYDPVTGIPAPNSYAYASGTSLAAPFVSGEAALIKSLYPTASNVEIRDRIISTADYIDNLNLSQCAGYSCAGLLGSGRINAEKSIEQVLGTTIKEGDLVQEQGTGVVYQISGGQKRIVSPFVFNQRFSGQSTRQVANGSLSQYITGPYATPLEGTLVKADNAPAVYIITQGLKSPITYQIFTQRKLNFSQVNTVSFSELNSWTTGNFLAPAEGTLVKAAGNQTVYWTVAGLLHPVNYGFFVQRGLNIFPILAVSQQDINGYAKGEAYIR